MTRPAAPARSEDLIEVLHQFNRKERFILLRWVAGGIGGGVDLSADFRGALGERLGETVPQDATVFTDYHLDCLYAALNLCSGWDGTEKSFPKDALTGTQEDIDLLVVWRAKPGYRLVLVEAKAFSGWENKQLRSKAKRLGAIFGETGGDFPNIYPSFVLTSFHHPTKISTQGWPSWLTPNDELCFVKLPDPVRGRLRVVRGKSLRSAGYRIVDDG